MTSVTASTASATAFRSPEAVVANARRNAVRAFGGTVSATNQALAASARFSRTAGSSGTGSRSPLASRTTMTAPMSVSRAPPSPARPAAESNAGQAKVARTGA